MENLLRDSGTLLSNHCFISKLLIFSFPFPVEEDEEGQGDADRRGPSHPGPGKGPSKEQKDNLDMAKHVMLSLDEEDGLDQIYTFRLEFILFFLIVIFNLSHLFLL